MAETKSLPFHMQFAAGAIAGVSEISAMYPLDVVKTRFQLQYGTGPAARSSVLGCLRSIVRDEGFSTLYRGILAPLLVEAPKRATKFAANEQYGALVRRLTGRQRLGQAESVAVGVASGMTEACVVVSFEMVKVRMQDKASIGRYRGTLDCVLSVLREEGPLAFVRGLEATVWRHAMWNGGYFGVIYGVRNRIALAHSSTPAASNGSSSGGGNARGPASKLAEDFVAGAIGGTVGTVLNTPFDVAKTRIQNSSPARPKYMGRYALPVLAEIAREEGPSALYKGFAPKVLRLGPGGGILLVVFELVTSAMRERLLNV